MPLLEMSPNVQEAEGARKRSHDEYADEVPVKTNGTDGTVNPPNREHEPDVPSPRRFETGANCTAAPALPTRLGVGRDSPDESLSSLTDGSPTPPRASPSPNQAQPAPPTTDSPQTASQPAAKRKRLTAAEKAAKADEEAKKKKEKEDARQQKLAEKARLEKEKAAAKAARQAEKAKKEEAEQEAKAAKQQERDEKRRKKAEEERRVREEKEKKERNQLRLQSFFKKPSTPKKAASPAPGNETEGGSGSPSVTASGKKGRTQYERMFQPFFVKEQVRVARNRPWLDDEAAQAKARILDEYVGGERGEAAVAPFRPLEALQVAARPERRGRTYPPVRGIMEELQGNPSALQELKRIPTKLICFRQDVRPPYCGTLTTVPHQLGAGALARAARRPNGRVLELAYDYDSEAEWQDDEPGDDLDDMDDEEEDLDDEDDMDGFLDDSEDAGVARRIFAGSMEPVATGPCWEGGEVHPDLKAYRMEVMLGTTPSPPFSLPRNGG